MTTAIADQTLLLERSARAVSLTTDLRKLEAALDESFFGSSARTIVPPPPGGFFVAASSDRGTPFGKLLRNARERRGMTQSRLAEISGILRPNIARLETGPGRPNLATLQRLALALDLSVPRLLSGD